MTPKWGFGVAMLSVGALCFYQVHFGRTVLPKWPLWARLFYSVFYSASELRRACFRQARVARAVLPPSALFRAGAFAFPPCAPTSHMRPLPHLGVSVMCILQWHIAFARLVVPCTAMWAQDSPREKRCLRNIIGPCRNSRPTLSSLVLVQEVWPLRLCGNDYWSATA